MVDFKKRFSLANHVRKVKPEYMEMVKMPEVFRHQFCVSEKAIDGNGHVNNVCYLQWMQDIAVLHSEESGCTGASVKAGAIWVVRSHYIEYLRPAFAGDHIEVLTWVTNFRRAISLRKYKFIRVSDNNVLSRGETDWVFVDVKSGRPRSIPVEVQNTFELIPENLEP